MTAATTAVVIDGRAAVSKNLNLLVF